MDLPPLPVLVDVGRLVNEVCLGNRSARDFCEAFVEFFHLVDDVIDGDMPPRTQENFARIMWKAAEAFARNEFFQSHRAALLPLIVQSVQAYEDSLTWEKETDIQLRRAADVLKSQYQEILWHIAYIVGGREHLAAMTARWRHYQFDAQ